MQFSMFHNEQDSNNAIFIKCSVQLAMEHTAYRGATHQIQRDQIYSKLNVELRFMAWKYTVTELNFHEKIK